MSFQAEYFDGVSARAKPVLVSIADIGQTITLIDDAGERLSFALSELKVQSKLGNAKRLIELPNGGHLEALDVKELEAAIPSNESTFWKAVHYLENHLGWVVASLALTVLTGWLLLQFGVPKLAEQVAKATPPEMEMALGERVLEALDSKVGSFTPSAIEKSHQINIEVALRKLCNTLKNCPQYQLNFRKSEEIGANAFALPGGIMVVTDGLVDLSKNDTEVVAVLAHELGHVDQRHAFRQSIQGLLSGLIIAAATGDVSSMASGLPALLIEMRYTREHETEADQFALNALQKACLPPQAFADILQRLDTQEPKDNESKLDINEPKQSEKSVSKVSELISSHPDTQSRIKPFLSANQSCKY